MSTSARTVLEPKIGALKMVKVVRSRTAFDDFNSRSLHPIDDDKKSLIDGGSL